MEPVLSIVTINLNQREKLEETLDEIDRLNTSEFEHVIIDGGSVDGSRELLEGRSGRNRRFISEKDSGIAEAMNKGVAHSNGAWIIFLHAGDRFSSPESCSELMGIISSSDNYDGLLFDTEVVSRRHSFIRSVRTPSGFLRKLPYCHQGSVWKRHSFSLVGEYSERYRICMDFDWHLRASKIPLRLKIVHSVITVMDGDGVSSRKDWVGMKTRLLEENLVLRNNADSGWVSTILKIYGWFYIGLRGVLNAIGFRI